MKETLKNGISKLVHNGVMVEITTKDAASLTACKNAINTKSATLLVNYLGSSVKTSTFFRYTFKSVEDAKICYDKIYSIINETAVSPLVETTAPVETTTSVETTVPVETTTPVETVKRAVKAATSSKKTLVIAAVALVALVAVVFIIKKKRK